MTDRRTQVGYVTLGLLVALLGLAFGGPLADVGDPLSAVTPTTSTESQTETQPAAGLARVTVRSPNGTTLGEIHAMVAATPGERYTGLSDTDHLEQDEGMVFVYPQEGVRTYVMRDMAFPLDMIFVGSNGTITAIHEAPVENDSDLTRYSGRAQWVIEVNRGWTTEHDVSVGDQVTVDLPDS